MAIRLIFVSNHYLYPSSKCSPPPVATLTDAPTYTSYRVVMLMHFQPDINYSNNSTCLISGVLTPV
ncbi:MAG: hypothetical protein IPJ39_19700 [Saprospiraceae bacterium]|nr:hypothetical protein [Saprospiraceae bacterium]